MYHVCAYTQPLALATPLLDMTAVSDDIIPISNNHFLPYQDYMLIAIYIGSATITRAEINSGTIRQINPTFINPLNGGATPTNNPNVQIYNNTPFRIHAQEELQILASCSAAGPEQATAILFLQDQATPAPVGDIFTLHGSSTTAAVANKWTTVTYTLDTGLPAGRYAMVDSVVQSANGIAHRWIFDNQVYRAGQLSITALVNRRPYLMENGRMGLMGYFYTYSLPRLQVMANAADAAHDLLIKVVKVG